VHVRQDQVLERSTNTDTSRANNADFKRGCHSFEFRVSSFELGLLDVILN
jgi:hypothetical protein